MTLKEMEVAYLAMKAEKDALALKLAEAEKANQRTLSLKVSEKGAVSIYGFGRFPVTVYAPNLVRLFSVKDAIAAFVNEHKAELVWGKGKLPGVDAPESYSL